MWSVGAPGCSFGSDKLSRGTKVRMNSEDPWETSWRGEEVSGQGFVLTYDVGTIFALNTVENHGR